MSALQDIVVANVYGQPVSLHDMLYFLKIHRKVDFLNEALRGSVITHAITQAGITVSDDELQQAVNDFRRTHKLYSTEDTQNWLQQRQMTIGDLQQRFEHTVAAAKLREQVTLPKVEKYFAENRLAFDAVEIAHILVEREGMASEIFSQVTEEEVDFATMARLHSIDDATKDAGGYMGRITRKAVSPALEAAVFTGKRGTVVGPIPTSRGYHVVQVLALHPATLDDTTQEEIQNILYAEWLQEAIQQAEITVSLFDQL